jgi:protein SMG7
MYRHNWNEIVDIVFKTTNGYSKGTNFRRSSIGIKHRLAVYMDDQISEEEKKLAELRRSKGPFDRAVRTLTTNIRQSYESFIVENLAASEPGEQQLWRLHYSFIEEFRGRLVKLKAAATAAASIPNKKKVVEEAKFQRVGGQYKCFLDEATGFYHGLVAKLRAKHGLPPELSSSTHAASKKDCLKLRK